MRIFATVLKDLPHRLRAHWRLLFALASALLLIIVGYMVNNLPVFTGEDLNQYAWLQVLKDKIKPKQNAWLDSVAYVNVAYDRQLVDYYDHGAPVGSIDITDRQKLLTYLQLLAARDKYRYIFLDVRFEPGVTTEVDSALFAQISAMPRIVVASGQEGPMPGLEQKTACADYLATIVATNFTRYNYLGWSDGAPYMPLYAYRELTGRNIERHGVAYTCDDRLCRATMFLSFSADKTEFEPVDSFDITHPYENLGSEILSMLEYNTPDEIASYYDDRYIVIGDVVNDVHDTYAGLKPGPTIIYNAFSVLMAGEHYVSWPFTLVLFLVYFAIAYNMFSRESLLERLPLVRRIKSRALHFALTLVGYSFVLMVVDVCMYFVFERVYSFFIAALYFSIVQQIITYRQYCNEGN